MLGCDIEELGADRPPVDHNELSIAAYRQDRD